MNAPRIVDALRDIACGGAGDDAREELATRPRMRTGGEEKQYAAIGAAQQAFNANGARHPSAGAIAPPNKIPNATPNGTHK
mmetsp:Transcript_8803/g.28941  ORF Transcript_8803/g.28941 Transcript_8803/m.28941 type:complete len:81 (+) Transcript_8803:803-1045(+)